MKKGFSTLKSLVRHIRIPKNLSSLRIKLILSFLVPVAFIIVLGVVSFQKAASGFESNYEKSASQVLGMTGEYINFGLDSIGNTVCHQYHQCH